MLLDNKKLKEEISKNARKFIINERTWEMNTKKVIDVYKFAIKKYK